MIIGSGIEEQNSCNYTDTWGNSFAPALVGSTSFQHLSIPTVFSSWLHRSMQYLRRSPFCALLYGSCSLRPSLPWITPFQELYSSSIPRNICFPMSHAFSSPVSAKYALHISLYISTFVSSASPSSSCLNFLFISPTPHNSFYFLMMFERGCHVLLIPKFWCAVDCFYLLPSQLDLA